MKWLDRPGVSALVLIVLLLALWQAVFKAAGADAIASPAQTFAYLKRRVAEGDLVLADAVLPGSFGARAVEP